MKKFFLLWIMYPFFLPAQQNPAIHILEYHVEASLDDRHSEVKGIASVWVKIVSPSLDKIQFRIPSNIDIDAVRDIDNDRFSQRRLPIDKGFYTHIIELPSQRQVGDSIFFKMEFEGVFDTSSYASLFINSREFLLQYSNTASWLPQFETETAERTSLQLAAPHSLRIISAALFDSTSVDDEKRTWYFSQHGQTSLRGAFTLCGSTALSVLTEQSVDSLSTITFFVDTTRFHPNFADSLLTFLLDASAFFKEMTGTTDRKFNQTIVCIGEDNGEQNIIHTGTLIIKRNSPAYSVFDTVVFSRSLKNDWLLEAARYFSFPHSNSTALFDDALAGYLSTRYILTKFTSPIIERRERMDLLTNAISFFPVNPLVMNRIDNTYDRDNLLYKGRYVFLMLEHLLGKESFTQVIGKLYEQSVVRNIALREFQILCEEEYGSSLEWFFQEWLYKSSIPEFVVQWNAEKKQRGSTIVTLTVEQRSDVFTMPLTVVFNVGSKKIPKRIFVEQPKQDFSFAFNIQPASVELDPQLSVLRWLLDIRILAHARSSRLFRVYNKDISSSEREALLTLELDPVNATGSAPLAFFSLGKLSVLQNNLELAKEYFLKAMQSKTGEETIFYPLLSVVRYGNVLEMEGKRNEALPLYQRALNEGRKNPLTFATVIIEAEKYLRTPFISTNEFWYGTY